MALCPVCWWEDDGQEDDDAGDVRLTVNGELSLREARQHYAVCGAAHPRFLPTCESPRHRNNRGLERPLFAGPV